MIESIQRPSGARLTALVAGLVLAGASGGAFGAGATDYRIGPAPGWVHPQAWTGAPAEGVSAPGVAYGGRYDLVDDQTRLLPAGTAAYHHVVVEAVTEKGVDDLSHHEIEFDPGYQTLTLNQLDIVRDGRRASRLRSVKARVLQRERDLESRVYDGRSTVDLDLDDVRPGDVLEFAYTLEGQNPVFGSHHAGGADMQWRVPVMHLYRSVSWPVDMPVRVRSGKGAAAPVASSADGWETRAWDARDVPALQREAGTPRWYDPYAEVEWSDYADWADVGRWAEALFRVPTVLGPELEAVVARIEKQDPDADARVMDVLRLVQKQVRYLGIEVGSGSHLPSPPDVVYARRFGDCKEKALLMAVLLRAMGIAAAPALVDTEARHAPADELPSHARFDHVIVRVRLGGRDWWLDPTRAPQGGTLANVVQSSYGRALVLDGSGAGLAAMPEAGPGIEERRVDVDIDGSAGTDKPAGFTVSTLYLAQAADALRDQLGDGERGELQRRYVNFYAGSYPGIRVAAPMEIADDPVANTVRVTEHYAIDDFWHGDGDDRGRHARFDANDLDAMLKRPDEPIRTMPLASPGPMRTTLHLHARLPQSWDDARTTHSVDDPAFRFRKTTRIHGNEFDVEYLVELESDHVEAALRRAYVAHIERARRQLGDRLDAADAPLPVAVPSEDVAGTNGRRAMAIGGAAAAGLVVLVAWGTLRARAASRRLSTPQGDASSLHGPSTVPDVIDAVGATDVPAPRALGHGSTIDRRPSS
ncbi:MAG: DUF3857 domain-containing transglutaminase family protein [Burkholderiaceae bacterium]